jgi:hypothetical protein
MFIGIGGRIHSRIVLSDNRVQGIGTVGAPAHHCS